MTAAATPPSASGLRSAFLQADTAPAEVARSFSSTYAQARERFLAAAAAAGLPVHSELHPLRGHDGEALALDVALDGAPDAQRLLIVSSGCHGVEGFAGSGAQVAMLGNARWRESARRAGVAVLYLHALNPHGFSFWRRVTDENVDLNRNFVDFTKPLPANPGYDELADLLVPAQWPPGWRNRLAVLGFVARRGVRSLQTAISAGQYAHADGLFHGGRAPTWSHLALRRVLRQHAGRARRLAWIDLHSGLGPAGVGEAILASPAAAAARARAWWGPQVTSVDDGSSVSAPLTGLMWNAAVQECPQAEYTGIVLEFGTVSMWKVIEALRADQWLHNHPGERAARGAAIRHGLREAFYIDQPGWKLCVVDRVLEVAQQAVEGLASSV